MQLAIGEVDLANHQLTLTTGPTRSLSSQEVALLRFFAAHPNQDITRQRLLTEVMGYAPNVRSRAADDALKRLRTKVERFPSQPIHLISVHGVGYRFVPLREAAHDARRLLKLSDRVVDLDRFEVRVGSDPSDAAATHSLSAQEGRLLEVLAETPGVVVSIEKLLWHVWGLRSRERRSLLNSLVYRLRGKLEAAQRPPVLRTVRGKGLALELPEPSAPAARGWGLSSAAGRRHRSRWAAGASRRLAGRGGASGERARPCRDGKDDAHPPVREPRTIR
ncbi:MAG: winged helix-turn-helix domain-containing protein [Myxococcota bacterium]